MSSSARFGYEWARYHRIFEDAVDRQFRNWVWPLTPRDFLGKSVLDAGCGMGRNSLMCARYGASRIIAFDKDPRTVAAASRNLTSYPQASVIQADIYDLPWENTFDLIICIGVIHHLAEPARAIHQLRRALKPGGDILLWVYSRVGFERLLSVLEPVRRLTGRLPPPLVHQLAYLLSLPLWAYLQAPLTHRPYFQQLRSFHFAHLHSIVFDQLLPTIARYYTQTEARALLPDFSRVRVYAPPNHNGWIVRGLKPTDAAQSTGRTTAARPGASTTSCGGPPGPGCAH